MILAIDVGGTKTLLALYDEVDGSWCVYKQKEYKSHAYSNITEILASFLATESDKEVECVCAGVAGTIARQSCKITNLVWTISVAEIQQATGVKSVYLLNDLAATAWAVGLAEMQYEEINTEVNASNKKGNVAVLSAGTGLGEAILINDSGNHTVLSTEGGHASFAPQNEEQDRLLVYLRDKYEGHVSYERLISGEGLHNIYLFLMWDSGSSSKLHLLQEMTDENPAEIISKQALLSGDKFCCEALRIFCEIYAEEAGNLALKCLPQAGVVLAGGISPKILLAIKGPHFMASFVNKGRYSSFLKGLSVRVCLDENAVLLGALSYAKLQAK